MGAVIFQIYPRSFQDGNDDGIGDLIGAIDRLDYISSLGPVDAVWVSPVLRSPMKDFGYDVADYTTIDPIFGDLATFDAFVDHAHDHGLRILIDLPLNHTSIKHPWFQSSRGSRDGPCSDWYVWADSKPDGSEPNNWLSSFGGSAWEWEPQRNQYYLHNFMKEMPDLNFHNPEVQDAVLNVLRYWLERGVDGARLDVVNYYFHDSLLRDNPAATIPNPDHPHTNPYAWQEQKYSITQPENLAFLESMRSLVDEFPGAILLGELSAGHIATTAIADYTKPGRLHTAYSFDLTGDSFSPSHFKQTIDAYEQSVQNGWVTWTLSNHDVQRTASRFSPDPDHRVDIAKLSMALLCSLRGSICIYQGEELGLPDAVLKREDIVDPRGIEFWPDYAGRDGARTPIVWQHDATNAGFSTNDDTWLPIPDDHLPLAVNRQVGTTGSMLETTRELLALRQRHAALKVGEINVVHCDEALLILRRYAAGDTIYCVFNLSPTEREWSNGTSQDQEILSSNAAEAHRMTLRLGGYGYALLTFRGKSVHK